MDKLEISMVKMEKDISFIKESLVRNDQDHAAIHEVFTEAMKEIKTMLRDFDDKCARKYAAYWVQRVVAGLVGAILLFILGIILSSSIS